MQCGFDSGLTKCESKADFRQGVRCVNGCSGEGTFVYVCTYCKDVLMDPVFFISKSPSVVCIHCNEYGVVEVFSLQKLDRV